MTDHPAPQTGRRIELDVEVPGTPEEVWHAIATGPSISSWRTSVSSSHTSAASRRER